MRDERVQMYSESDLDAAVAAGKLSPEAAAELRGFVANQQRSPTVDEENFRMLTGFNDIFVTLALSIALFAVWRVSAYLLPFAAWGLAEYFTRIRRMALPSLVLLLVWSWSIFILTWLSLLRGGYDQPLDVGPVAMAVLFSGGAWSILAALVTVAATWAHWRRFRVPITVAAGTQAGLAAVLFLLLWARPSFIHALPWLLLLGGLVQFSFAMWWDSRDRQRITRSTDIAFWLHLGAAPLLVHPIFSLLGLMEQDPSLLAAGGAVALYLLLGLVALAIDRRALLVSGLIYVLVALGRLLGHAGGLSDAVTLTALLSGGGLLLLSAWWRKARKIVVAALPEAVQRFLPVAA